MVGLLVMNQFQEKAREQELREMYESENQQNMFYPEETDENETVESETEEEPHHFITFIDDDGYQTFYEKMLPIIEEKGISISTAVEMENAGTGDFMTWETIAECHERGAEILNHTLKHIVSKEEAEALTTEEKIEQFEESKRVMEEHGYENTKDILVYSGASAGATWPEAQKTMRVGINSSGNEVNVQPFSQYNMHRYVVGSDHVPDFEEMKGYIDEVAQTDEGWEIWMMHSHNGYMTDEYIEAFKQAIDYCNEVGVEIVSAEYALDYFGIPGTE